MTTTARHLTIAAVKAVGLLQMLNALRLLLGSSLAGGGALERFLSLGATIGIAWAAAEFAVGLVLVLRTDWIVAQLFGASGAEPEADVELGTAGELVAVLMVVAGAVLALYALPSLLADVVRLVFMLGWSGVPATNVRGSIFWSETLRHAIAFVVGIWFVRNWSAALRVATSRLALDDDDLADSVE